MMTASGGEGLGPGAGASWARREPLTRPCLVYVRRGVIRVWRGL